VRAQIAGYTFTGIREDGAEVTATFCENGKYKSAVTSYGSTGTSTGTTWFVRHLTYKSSSTWATQVGENKDRVAGGWGQGLARTGGSFQIGLASFDGVFGLGPATRTSGATVCAAL